MNDSPITVFLAGQFAVGKSNYAMHIKEGSAFQPLIKQPSTIMTDFIIMAYDLEAVHETVRVMLLDAPGRQSAAALVPQSVRHTDIILFVYDITKRASFVALRTDWLPFRDRYCDNKNVISVLIANKKDLVDKHAASREVSQEDARAFAKEIGAAHFYELSAIDIGVDGLELLRLPLDIALTEVVERRRKEKPPPARSTGPNVLLTNTSAGTSSKTCCA